MAINKMVFNNVAALKARNSRYMAIATAVIAEGCRPFLKTNSLSNHLLENAFLNRKIVRDIVVYKAKVVIIRNKLIVINELGGIKITSAASANQDNIPIITFTVKKWAIDTKYLIY